MRNIDSAQTAAIAEKLLAWFAVHQRPLPWRTDYAPYAVWISEMMLQQTQMERGVSYFLRWMQRFPTVASVAAAPEEDILHAWEGLGYYRRARYIQAAARAMVARHDSKVPDTRQALEALPGLGPYTVAAILGIAFNQDEVCIDANVERVLSRLFNIDSPPKKAPANARIAALTRALLPSGQARQFNQAMMEFGALVCSKKARCSVCPLSGYCLARQANVVDQRPVLQEKPAIIEVNAAFGVLALPDGLLLQRRAPGGLWEGMWQFPGLDVKGAKGAEGDPQGLAPVFADLGFSVKTGVQLGLFRHGYTNHRLSARFFHMDLLGPVPELASGLVLLPLAKGKSLPMPAHHRKMMDSLMRGQSQLTLF